MEKLSEGIFALIPLLISLICLNFLLFACLSSVDLVFFFFYSDLEVAKDNLLWETFGKKQ